MATVNYQDVGVADIATDRFDQVELFAGDTPAVVTDYGVVSADVAASGIPAWTPVHVDPATREVTVVTAEAGEGEELVKANAITVAAVVAGASAGSQVPVYKAGCFNINALNYDASFETAEAKFSAFDMSECQIYIKAPFYG